MTDPIDFDSVFAAGCGDAADVGSDADAQVDSQVDSDSDWDSLSATPGAGDGADAFPGGDGRVSAADSARELTGIVPAALGGTRLDKVLAQLFPAYSRARLQEWVESGHVQVDDAPAKLRQPAIPGSVVRVLPQADPVQNAFGPEPIELTVVAEDESLLVLDKPVGLVVHPAAGNWSGTLLNGLLARYGDAAAALPRAGIVHRLDKETSGLMVVARTLVAQTDLVRQLQARTVKRRYLALVWGHTAPRRIVDAPIGRDPRERVRMAVVSGPTGKPARTHFTTLGHGTLGGRPVSALLCELETGRTHQIRVHSRSIGHPLIGDRLYGGHAPSGWSPHDPQQVFAHQALHAWRLGLMHPISGTPAAWRAEPPADFVALARAAGLADTWERYMANTEPGA